MGRGKAITVLAMFAMLVSACASASAADTAPANLTEGRDALVGKWGGTHESWSPGGALEWSGRVDLELRQQSAEFQTANGRWTTPAQFYVGRVVLQYGHASREFVLRREGKRLILETEYHGMWQGRPRINKIALTKG